MSTKQPDEHHHDPHGIDPIYHEFAPDDSGTAESFDSRHNEFGPEHGHHGAAHDPRTHEEIHGDGMAEEEATETHHGEYDAEQPSFVSERLQHEAMDALAKGETRHEHLSEKLTGKPPELEEQT